MAWVQHAIGCLGVLCTNGLALTLLTPVFEARREGNLAGLDARLWPLNFVNQMLWTSYSLVLGDVWLFLACGPAAVMWLFFCLTVVELLSQEEGELQPCSPHTQTRQQDLLTNFGVQNFDRLFRLDSQLHGLSKKHRRDLIRKTEAFICGGLLFSGLVGFALTPDKFLGFPMLSLPEETRLRAFGFICMAITVACYIEPVKKVRSVLKSRDATSIFLPNVFGSIVSLSIWLSYGVVTGNLALIIPQCIGLTNFSALIVLRLIFGSTTEDETAAKTGAPSGDVVGIPEAWGAACPSPLSTQPPSPRFSHKRCRSADSNSSWASSVSARSGHKLVTGSGQSSTTGNGDGVADLEDHESMHQSETFGSLDALPSQANSLPDLSERLREMGVYEDYLKWQRDYQRWRKGGAKGARGECQVGVATASAIRDADVIDEEG